MENYNSINTSEGYAFLTPDGEEWERAWEMLSFKLESNDFDGWQYMGTVVVGHHSISGRTVSLWMHQFRNREYKNSGRTVFNITVWNKPVG